MLGELLPWPLVLLAAAAVGAAWRSSSASSTLRLSGIYFVIFTFGLAELIRQLVTWYEVNVTGSIGRYVFLDISQTAIFWQLLVLAVAVFVAGWLIHRSRLGLALRVIGEDEVVARHCGIDTARAKLLLFVISAVFMTLTGAIMAPRWTYIDPAIAFNPLISFQVVIMALLGGAGALFGPAARRRAAGAAVRPDRRELPELIQHPARLHLHRHRLRLPRGVVGLRATTGGRRTRAGSARRQRSFARPTTASSTSKACAKSFGGLRAVDDVSLHASSAARSSA